MKRVFILFLLFAAILSGCSLAQPDEGGRDVLVGFLATRDPLDLFDWEGYFEDHPEVMNGGEIAVDKVHQGRLYGTWDPVVLSDGTETLHCTFPLEDAFFAICALYPPVPNSLDYIFNSSSGEFLSLDISDLETENGREVAITASVAAVTTTDNVRFYLNPVYQSPDGSVYALEGSGTSSDASQPGAGFSQTMEETATLTMDGDPAEAYRVSLSFSLELRSAPQSITVRAGGRRWYASFRGRLYPRRPAEALTPEGDCAYLVIETQREDSTVDGRSPKRERGPFQPNMLKKMALLHGSKPT